MQFIEETDGRDPRLAQSVRTPAIRRIGQTEVEGPMFDVTVTGYQPVKFVQDPTSNSNNNDRVDSSDCDMPVYRFGEVLLIYAEAKAELGTLTQDDLGSPSISSGAARACPTSTWPKPTATPTGISPRPSTAIPT